MIRIEPRNRRLPWYFVNFATLDGGEKVWCVWPLAPLFFLVGLFALMRRSWRAGNGLTGGLAWGFRSRATKPAQSPRWIWIWMLVLGCEAIALWTFGDEHVSPWLLAIAFGVPAGEFLFLRRNASQTSERENP